MFFEMFIFGLCLFALHMNSSTFEHRFVYVWYSLNVINFIFWPLMEVKLLLNQTMARISLWAINQKWNCVTRRWNWIWATTTSQSRLLYRSNCGRNSPQIVTVWIFFTAGANVLQSAGHYWRLSDSGQRRRGSIQTETSQQIPAVYWTSFSGSLSHLHGKTHFTSIDFSWAIGRFGEIRNLQVLLTSRRECSRRLTHGVCSVREGLSVKVKQFI